MSLLELEAPGWLLESGWVVLALALLTLLLLIARSVAGRLSLVVWGIPEALLAGVLGLLMAPDGPLPLLPEGVMRVWAELPQVLLTLVFACLMLGKPLPKLAGLWRPVSGQISLALVLAFGQYVVGGLAVLLVLGPRLGVSPMMACLIEVAFEGGHGSAAAMGPSYAALGFPGGQALGLTLASAGLVASTLVGGLVVLLGRQLGWLSVHPEDLRQPPRTGGLEQPSHPGAAAWLVNLALSGVAVLVGLALLGLLRLIGGLVGGGVDAVVDDLPVFPFAILGSLLTRLLLERSGQAHRASAPIQTRVSTTSADLLITAATAGLDLGLLRADWLPLSVLIAAGLAWNLAVVLILGPRILPRDWFERAVIEFGQATGVSASGLVLLHMADPFDQSTALPAFSIKQLMLQPFLAGGVITVVAPLAVAGWGLPVWTGVCLALVLIFATTGLVLAGTAPKVAA
ncbi:sodium:solute symporter [Cyanobium sp. NIES-981]|uniref:sodium:solute symporter n=1 Tax=Cyanobium sp. NIES-981 TaxID=1851505 RepID=UPI0007DD2DF3|nr:sodium:solute symporter [Cyanobium sp. NIES-981]SBO44697.1 Na+/glutamate symporter [Cyanobium sp. NIES-981]